MNNAWWQNIAASACAVMSGGFWREMKVGCLTTLTREVHEHDP
jgi:hypothetical protein